MKHFSLAKHPWHEPTKFRIAGVTESEKAWVAFLIMGLVLLALVVGFAYSSTHTIVPYPTR
jgi:hypothetical protein